MVANNSFVDQGISYIKAAVAADEKGDYENALKLYQDGVGRVAMAIKYEKNESSRKLLMERCDGWLKRAEELKDQTGGGASPTGDGKGEKKENGSGKTGEDDKTGGGASPAGGGKGEGKENGSGKTGEDDEKKDDEDACTNNLSDQDKTLRGTLDSVIVSEKPNVKWDDVAGLDGAKESLKEAVIMPVKFPQLFTGERRPFKGLLLYGPPVSKVIACVPSDVSLSLPSCDQCDCLLKNFCSFIVSIPLFLPIPHSVSQGTVSDHNVRSDYMHVKFYAHLSS